MREKAVLPLNAMQTPIPNMSFSPSAAGGGEYDLMVHGDIGESFWGESVSAKSVVTQLRKLAPNTKQINIRINSFGGSVADGLAIYNALRDSKARKVAIIDGVAISAGSLIAMAGDEIHAPKSALMMIHGPWTVAQGNSAQMRKHADVLDKWADAMVSAYVRKTGKSEDEIRSMLKDGQDHWFTAEEAVTAGFVDRLLEETVSSNAKALLDRAPESLRHMAMAHFAAMPRTSTKEAEMPEAENPVEPIVEPEAAKVEEEVVKTPAEPEAAKVEPETVKPAPEASIDVAAALASARAAMEVEFQAKISAANAELAQAQARLAVEIDAKELRQITVEVTAAFGNLPGKVEDLAGAVRAMRKADPAAAAVVEATLKAANALVAQSLDPLGRTAAESLTPEQEVNRLAIQAKAANPALTIEQARAKVYTENPKLTAAVRGEEV